MSSLKTVIDRDVPAIGAQLSGLVAAQAAIALSGTTDGNIERNQRSFTRLAALIAGILFMADLMGRRQIIGEARKLGARIPESNVRVGVPSQIRFPATASAQESAARDVLGHEPTIAMKATEIARVYQEHGQAAARSAKNEAAKAVQRSITRMKSRGEDEIDEHDVAADLAAWTEQYTETVYKTNVATAFSAGVFAAAKSAEVQRVAGAFELVGIDDAVTRRGRREDRGEDHLAGFGLIAAFGDPIWRFAGPPNGYGCRETTRLVSWNQLQKAGLVVRGQVVQRKPAGFDSFAPHVRFRGQRPDEQIYGTA